MSKKNVLRKIGLAAGLVLFSVCTAAAVFAAQRASLPSVKDTSVSIPVDEFGKFIKDGRISMPWSEFEKLVVSDSSGRYLRLSWESFLKYLEPSAATPKARPPADYILSSFIYSGKTEKNNLTLKFSANLFVLKDSADGWTTVKLWPVYAGFLARFSLNEKQARVLTSDGYYQLLVEEAGVYRLEGEMALKLSGDSLRFPVPPNSGSCINLVLPADYNVVAQGAVTLRTDRAAESTRTEVTFAPNSAVEVSWMPVIKEPDEAKVLATAAISYAVQPESVRTNAAIRYEILYKPVRFLRVAVPQGVRINGVSGDLIDWKEDAGVVQAELKPETKGIVNLYLSYEQDLKADAVEIELVGPQVMDAEKTSGYVAVNTTPNIEIAAVPSEGLTIVDPREASGMGQRPVLAFRFNRLPFSAKLNLVHYEELPVLEATVDSVNAITAATIDGKTVTRVIFHIRNNAKQFLRVELPKAARLWSVYVADAPTKPLAGQGDEILIPLLKGGVRTNYALPVEVIYYLPGKAFDKSGDFQAILPTIDVPIMHFMYSLYLPEKIRLEDFGGSLEKVNDFSFPEEIVAGDETSKKGEAVMLKVKTAGVLATPAVPMIQKPAYKEQQKDLEMNVQNISANNVSSREIGRADSDSSAGLLPLRIYIPATGQLLRFEKRLVIEEQLTVKARYRLETKRSRSIW